MIVQHNMTALNANRQLGVSNSSLAKSTEKLSSGYRINRAGDDAAGLSISEKMRGQIRGLNQASTNAQDGVSLIQTAEGALNEVHSVLQRMRELTVQSANDTNATADRSAIKDEQIECTATYSSRGDMVIETAFRILTHAPFVRDTILETTMIDAAAAKALLIKWNERQHELETMQLLQTQADKKWHKMQVSRIILIVIIVIISLLFCQALWYLFSKQNKIQREIVKTIIPQLEEVQEAIQLNHRDVAFAERLKQAVDDHLTDPNLNVEFLGSALGLSRTQIFRRVKTITGKGPLDYIRERRLIRADELLRTTDMTVQQVSMELCFSSPGYFTKCYKEYFGHLPSAR